MFLSSTNQYIVHAGFYFFNLTETRSCCWLRAETGRDAIVTDVALVNFPAFWVVEEIELRTQTSDFRFRLPTTNRNNNTNTSPSLVIARCAVSERALHRDTVNMPPKKRGSGTPQKKELKGNLKNGSPDSSENAVLSPERWAYTAPLTLK